MVGGWAFEPVGSGACEREKAEAGGVEAGRTMLVADLTRSAKKLRDEREDDLGMLGILSSKLKA